MVPQSVTSGKTMFLYGETGVSCHDIKVTRTGSLSVTVDSGTIRHRKSNQAYFEKIRAIKDKKLTITNGLPALTIHVGNTLK